MNTSYPRPLSQRERSVPEALLSVDFPDVERLRLQAQSVRVVSRCECGCPTIHFSDYQLPNRLVVDGETSLEVGQSVLLFVTDEGLDSLESGWMTDSPPTEFPKVEDLTIRPR